MAEAMLPAELAEVTDPLLDNDELLSAEELASLTLFSELKKLPSFQRFPGTTVLRKCTKGRVLVRQGQAGATAFSILTTEDVIRLRELQLKALRRITAALEEDREASLDHVEFSNVPLMDLLKREMAYIRELDELKQQSESFRTEGVAANQRHVASAVLLIGAKEEYKPGLLHRLQRMFVGKQSARGPDFIPIDGPADIDIRTKRAPLHEGELFGEMSCMNRAPRSATVVAERDCYMLEMLRNVLDQLHNDPNYKARLDAVYRARVLDGHVRRLPIFQDLTDAEFAELKERLELVDFEAGSVVFEEHQDSDSFYVIRSGLVKVVKNAWTLLRTAEFSADHWKTLCGELVELSQSTVGTQAWAKFPVPVRAQIEALAGTVPTPEQQQTLVTALNDFIQKAELHTALGKTLEDVVVAVDSPQVAVDCEHFPEEPKKWSELEVRTFHRSLLEFLCPTGIPRRAASSGARKILRYMGRGEAFGEFGLVTGSLRSATIFAYDHPDGGANQRLPDSRTGAVPSRVELVKIKREDFLALLKKSSSLKSKVDAIVAGYQSQARLAQSPVGDRIEVRSQSPEFEALGLVQGQRLMLIDLERCTRCGSCVDACVAAHEDGRTRLYLDGPRFEKYLIPLTCRSCLDPVCMIGCPVGSINRGDNGEIQIRDWCIGCSLCADQCPYGSIQMSPLPGDVQLTASQRAILGDAEMKSVSERAVVCDLCSSLPGKTPSCVYACPHDAALRVNSLDFFFKQGIG